MQAVALELSCDVNEVGDSYIPNVKILDMKCDRALVKMDIHKDLNPVEKGDRVNLGIYKYVPSYTKGKDFVAHGYVLSKRMMDNGVKIYISLWGYLVVITTSDNEIDKLLNPMDKVYVRLWR